jgi:hypothetical protein
MWQRRDVVVVIALCIALMVVLGAWGVTIKQLDTRARDSSRYTPPTTTEDSGDGSPVSLPGVGVSRLSDIVGVWRSLLHFGNSGALIAVLPSGRIIGPDQRMSASYFFVDSNDGLVKKLDSNSNTVLSVRVISVTLNFRNQPTPATPLNMNMVRPNGSTADEYLRNANDTQFGLLTMSLIEGNGRVRGDGRTVNVYRSGVVYDTDTNAEDDYRFVIDSAGELKYGNGTTVPYVNSVGGNKITMDSGQEYYDVVVYHGYSDRVMETFNFPQA